MKGHIVTLWIEMDSDNPADNPQKWDWGALIGESVAFVRCEDWNE